MIPITIENVTKVFGGGPAPVRAVDGATLEIEGGEFFFLLGPSGCGKTTLLRILAGLTEPTSGRILFGGRDVTALAPEKRRAAMVFQNYALWPHMNVAQNVQFGPRMQRRPAAERKRLARECLERVQMVEFERRRPNQLSGGQQQRVALARALAARPDVLLLDEPLSNLDARLRLHMRGQLRELVTSAGTTAVYVTHDQKEALSMADRIAVMHAGRVVQVGTPEALYDRPASRFVADFLGEANFVTGPVSRREAPACIETPVGTLRSAAAAPQGGQITCCVRPERIVLLPAAAEAPGKHAPAPAEDASLLGGFVEGVVNLGEVIQYMVRLAPALHWKVTCLSGPGRPAFRTGQPVLLRIAPADVILLAD